MNNQPAFNMLHLWPISCLLWHHGCCHVGFADPEMIMYESVELVADTDFFMSPVCCAELKHTQTFSSENGSFN